MNTATNSGPAPAAPATPPTPECSAAKTVKCVVWDLDHTLWHGILSEGDAVSLKPGVLELLQVLDARGILQSVASKNEHADAFAKLQELGVAEYFLYPQISWNPKSAAVAKVASAINIGIDTLLFIDDQPFERDEVAALNPQVECVDANQYADNYLKLAEHPRLNPAVISDDAARRRLMYQEDIQRKTDEEDFTGTPEQFLATLDMHLTIAPAKPEDLWRAEELTVRTNQLNSTGITYDMAELERFMHSPDHRLMICELNDKYGSYGKIGLTLIETTPGYDRIKLLLMSCRTASRGVGSVLLSYLMQTAKAAGKTLRADFRRTERNRQMQVTFQFGGFSEVSRDENGLIVFEHPLTQIQDYPGYMKLTLE